MTKESKDSGKNRCYVCGHLCYGRLGIDYHMVKTSIETRYYCQRCIENRLRGG